MNTIIYQMCELRPDQVMLPALVLCGKVVDLNAEVVICQPFPASMLALFDQDLDSLAQELLSETAAMFLIQGEETLAACFLDFVFDLPAHTCGCRPLAR